MVASDMVVGIVGSVLLVGVMVGVFVYEYNNVPAQATDPFATSYPSLDGAQDIDHDGIRNSADPDLDNDGKLNAVDPDIAVAVPVSIVTPNTPAPNAEVGSQAGILVGTGAEHVRGTLSYTSALPAPVPATPTLTVVLVDGAGKETPLASSQSGTTVTFTADFPDLASGNYTLKVREPTTGPSVTLSGTLEIHYKGISADANPGAKA